MSIRKNNLCLQLVLLMSDHWAMTSLKGLVCLDLDHSVFCSSQLIMLSGMIQHRKYTINNLYKYLRHPSMSPKAISTALFRLARPDRVV